MLIYPTFNPIAISIGPLAIRWYALAYVAGFILGWQYGLSLIRRAKSGITAEHFDGFLTWAVIGTLLGGRIGYVLFYQAEIYAANPIEIFKIWHGGMSFHGGALGVILAAYLYARRYKIPFFALTDCLAAVVPIGLGLGRVANFVNGELWGRVSDVPWAMIFPRAGLLPRHPSQIYEALLEGVILFTLMFFLARQPVIRARPGFLSGCFLFTYGLFRFTLELFREPDAGVGFVFGGATMGQLLCIPMMLYGFYLVLWSERRVRQRIN